MKHLIVFIIIVSSIKTAYTQQDPMFTKYMFNSLLFNPAYAGSQGYWDINATYRRQWLSLEGAPTTFLGAVDGAFNSTGLGFTLFHDQIGIDRRTDFSLNYAYHIRTTEGKLSLGIKAGGALFSTDFSRLEIAPGDPVYQTDESSLNPFAGFGLYYFSDNLTFGISSPTLITIDVNKNDRSTDFLKPHVYINIGTKFLLSDKVELRPSVLGSFQRAAPPQIHLNLTALFSNRFAIGLSYRSGDALNANAVVYVNDRFRIGVAYDYTLSKLKAFNNGSFELMFGYSFGKNIRKIQGVRNL